MTLKRTTLIRVTSAAVLFTISLTAALSAQVTTYTLEELIAMGLARNPRLAAGTLEVAARESAYQASRRLFNPEFEFRLGRADSHDKLENRRTFGLAITQPIESPFKRHHRIEIEKGVWEESRELHSARILETVFDIKLRFYTLLLLQEKELLLERISDSVRNMELLVRKRSELGEVKQLDAIKLQVETLKAAKEMTVLRAEMAMARDNLNVLLDNGLVPEFKVAGGLEFRPVPLDVDALLDRALAGHPLIQARIKHLEQRQSNILYVKGQRFPDLALSGFNDSELDGVNRGVAITLAIPLWNFKSKEVAEAVNLSRMSERELGAARLELANDVRASMRRVRLAEETLSIFTTALLRQVRESLDIAELSYREGEISLLDFLDSQRTYNSVLGDYQLALFDWNVAMAALEKAVGETIR